MWVLEARIAASSLCRSLLFMRNQKRLQSLGTLHAHNPARVLPVHTFGLGLKFLRRRALCKHPWGAFHLQGSHAGGKEESRDCTAQGCSSAAHLRCRPSCCSTAGPGRRRRWCRCWTGAPGPSWAPSGGRPGARRPPPPCCAAALRRRRPSHRRCARTCCALHSSSPAPMATPCITCMLSRGCTPAQAAGEGM